MATRKTYPPRDSLPKISWRQPISDGKLSSTVRMHRHALGGRIPCPLALPHPICYQDVPLPHRRRYWPRTRPWRSFAGRGYSDRLQPYTLATYRPIASVTSCKRQPVTKLGDAMRRPLSVHSCRLSLYSATLFRVLPLPARAFRKGPRAPVRGHPARSPSQVSRPAICVPVESERRPLLTAIEQHRVAGGSVPRRGLTPWPQVADGSGISTAYFAPLPGTLPTDTTHASGRVGVTYQRRRLQGLRFPQEEWTYASLSRVWTLQCTDVCYAFLDVTWRACRHVSIGGYG